MLCSLTIKYMKKYKVLWEVSKYVIVEAENENQAVDIVWEDGDDLEIVEGEITSPLTAYEIK